MKIKQLIAAALVATMLAGCGEPLTVAVDDHGKVSQKTYPTYGFLNMESARSAKMCYELSWGNIVWSVLLVETIVAPIYFIGFSIYNPVGYKKPDGTCPGIDG